jgi:spermidine dehydrogenase
MADHERLLRRGMDRPITRRDFIDGIAVSAAVAASGGALAAAVDETAPQDRRGYNPPSLTGLRGSHPGSFEAAHKLRDGALPKPGTRPVETGGRYDLIVVGGGISGLAAAYFYRAKAGDRSHILVLDNHDDFGGHAKRNEFELASKTQLINGGSLGIDSPRPYSAAAAGLLAALGIDPVAFDARYADPGFYASLGLGPGVFFDRETFGEDRLIKGKTASPEFLDQAPLSDAARRDLKRLETDVIDYLPGLTSPQKKARLSRISYRDYLLDLVKVDPSVIPLYQSRTHGEWGVGIDAVSALDVWPFGLPGFQGLNLDPGSAPHMGYTPAGYADGSSYRFHFPDGNASVARLLVRHLVPPVMPGSTAQEVVTARIDCGKLDRADNAGPHSARQHRRLGQAQQRDRRGGVFADDWALRGPSQALRARLLEYDDPVSLSTIAGAAEGSAALSGEGATRLYECGSGELAGVCVPRRRRHPLPGQLPLERAAEPGGRYRLLPRPAVARRADPGADGAHTLPARVVRARSAPGRTGRIAGDELRHIRRKDARPARPHPGYGGFDPARDITAITVNRWPHGYAYEYNPLFDPKWPPGEAPHEIGRARFGPIAIANSDAAAAAYTDAAIDQAHRAVEELLAG